MTGSRPKGRAKSAFHAFENPGFRHRIGIQPVAFAWPNLKLGPEFAVVIKRWPRHQAHCYTNKPNTNNHFGSIFKHAYSIRFRERWMPRNFRFFTPAFARHQLQNFTLGSTATA
jgi:hypothetical protein